MLAGGITSLKIFSIMEGLPSIEALSPSAVPGFIKIPSLATTAVVDVLVASTGGILKLHVAFFLVGDGDMVSLSLASKAYLPFVAGAMLGISPRGHFSPMVISFTTEVDGIVELAPLDLLVIWPNFFRLILFDIAAKKKTSVNK